MDDCERVSTAVSSVLDAYDPIASRYSLEVSSPGAERVLREAADWQAALGKNVRVKYRTGDSEMVVEGLFTQMSNDEITLISKHRTRKTEHVIPRKDVTSARIAVII